MQNKEVQFVDLKLIEYKQAWDLQETLLNRIATVKLANRGLDDASKGGTNNYLLFCQHPHVFTLGKSGKYLPFYIN
jgi:lipoyl(octanoyl) transferase